MGSLLRHLAVGTAEKAKARSFSPSVVGTKGTMSAVSDDLKAASLQEPGGRRFKSCRRNQRHCAGGVEAASSSFFRADPKLLPK